MDDNEKSSASSQNPQKVDLKWNIKALKEFVVAGPCWTTATLFIYA